MRVANRVVTVLMLAGVLMLAAGAVATGVVGVVTTRLHKITMEVK